MRADAVASAKERWSTAMRRLNEIRADLHRETVSDGSRQFKLAGMRSRLLIAQQAVAKAAAEVERAERKAKQRPVPVEVKQALDEAGLEQVPPKVLNKTTLQRLIEAFEAEEAEDAKHMKEHL